MLKKSSFRNVDLNCWEQGSGEALLLLHGFTESHRCWLPAAEALATQYRVLVPDLPGSGATGWPAGASLGIDWMAEAVWALLDAAKIARVTVVGHSMGGYVALEMLAQQAQRVAGIGLFHSHPYGDDPAKQQNRDRTIELIEQRGSKSFLHGFIPQLFAPHHRAPMAKLIAELEAQAQQQSVPAYVAQTRAMRNRPGRLPELKAASCPKLVVLGQLDPILPVEAGLAFAAQLDQVQLEILPTAGHMGMYECPEKTIAILHEFLTFVKPKH